MKEFKTERTHDSFYAKEDHFSEPKEYFKEAIKYIGKETNILKKGNKSILDVGCAAGDFLRYFNSQFNNDSQIELNGIEIMDSLIKEAKYRIPMANIKKIDIGYKKQNLLNIFGKKHDLITMFGVNCIFDDFLWLENILGGLKDDGVAIIYGIFNPYPYDVLMRVKKSKAEVWESGWNIFSKDSIIDYCSKLGFNSRFIDFDPDIDINPNTNDELRSWSIRIENSEAKELPNNPEIKRKRIFTSANRLIYDWSFCFIKKLNR